MIANVLSLYKTINAIPLHSGANEVSLFGPFSVSIDLVNPMNSPSITDVRTKTINPLIRPLHPLLPF